MILIVGHDFLRWWLAITRQYNIGFYHLPVQRQKKVDSFAEDAYIRAPESRPQRALLKAESEG